MFVYVAREDVASQAISRLRVKSTGIYHSTQNNSFLSMAGNAATKSSEPINFDICNDNYKCLDQIVSVSLEKAQWHAFFRMHNIKPYILYYEDVAADTDMKYIDLILSKVGIHPNSVIKKRFLSE